MRKSYIAGLVLLALVMVFMPARSSAQIAVGVAVHIGPPALPVYEQPICPGVGYLWTPGYWGWGGGGYFFHAGYWGPHVGFYGGINYGFGYGGVGFVGGRWNGGVFAYNTAVMHVNTTVIHNTYVDRTVVNNVTVNNHVSYNGGTGGVSARATSAELAAEHEHHIAPTSMQTQHEHAASTNRALLASENHGKPAIAATAKPGEFSGHGVVAAKAAANSPRNGSTNGGNRPSNNAADLHKTDRPPASSSHSGGAGSNTTTHANNTNTAHVNNAANNAPKNQPHPQNKPPAQNKPPKEEGKPHR